MVDFKSNTRKLSKNFNENKNEKMSLEQKFSFKS